MKSNQRLVNKLRKKLAHKDKVIMALSLVIEKQAELMIAVAEAIKRRRY